MLEIQDLHVSVHGTPVLKGIDLKVEAGETFILFGPNGSGKTTLLMTLMGFSGYEVTRGKIIFKGHDITYAPMYERARLGIGMSFQRPPTIHGLPTGKMVELCGRGRKMDIPAMAKRVHFDTFLDRDVNAGFSGGEIKRSELLQLMAQQPNLLLFDEPESGVDLENMALVGKTVLVFLGLCVLEGLGILFSMFAWSWGLLALLWIFEKLLLLLAVLALALMCRKLLLGGRALAAGDLSYQVDTSRMVLDFKSHGEDLNHIAQGMAAAVDQRMRSERMKTELITNVSHDIKTPLTSIINYADLIGKEPPNSEKIPEYAAVLTRQSERLKRLIEDLVEASKASTGNLEVNLAPCQPGVLLTQAAGEYEQKLKDAGLDLVTRQPETAVTILADGRRLWRVFDNLMNNICK